MRRSMRLNNSVSGEFSMANASTRVIVAPPSEIWITKFSNSKDFTFRFKMREYYSCLLKFQSELVEWKFLVIFNSLFLTVVDVCNRQKNIGI